ncbi:hypothetical protein [Nocardia brevicatena]|uniref:hypothetical protein n=1 Tax=Nocardia brevicatena TaxID=37327 RepID=UPI001C3F3FD8|nr:hypothetical protein [Nocardia brevicatena]
MEVLPRPTALRFAEVNDPNVHVLRGDALQHLREQGRLVGAGSTGARNGPRSAAA